jgi:hypothetical protein
MSRRILLGKAGSDYGLFISKIGVDVVNDSGTLCNKDLLVFDSREKGYAQVIKKGSVNVSRGTSTDPITFSSIAIPNPVVLLYADGAYVELTSVSTTAFILTVPSTYADIEGLGYEPFFDRGQGSTTIDNTPTTTTVKYIVLRGYA